MKKFSHLLFISFLILMNISCESEETTTKSVKKFQEDTKILQEFVRIDKQEKKYYLDLDTKDQFTALLPNSILQQAKAVSIPHKKQFNDDLDILNNYIRQETEKGATYVAMQTENDFYFDAVNTSKSTLNATRDFGPIIHEIPFTNPYENSIRSDFYAQDKVYTLITLFSDKQIGNLKATLECKTGTSIQNAIANSRIVITTPQQTFRGVFNWKNTVTGANVQWTFLGTVEREDILTMCNVYDGEYTGALPESL